MTLLASILETESIVLYGLLRHVNAGGLPNGGLSETSFKSSDKWKLVFYLVAPFSMSNRQACSTLLLRRTMHFLSI